MKLIVFDCDGVLFHSEQANIAFYNEVFRRAGEKPLDDSATAACHAMASAQLFEVYFGDRPTALDHVRKIAQEVDYTPFFSLMEPRDGLVEVLAQLRNSYKLAMATNRSKTTQEVLRYFGLEEYFEMAIGAHQVKRPKPHPDMLIRCIEHFGTQPHDSIYVGDQESDLQSAIAAGMHFIGIGPAGALAEHAITSLHELEECAARLLASQLR